MPLATAWSRPGSYITAMSACLATNGPGSLPIATWIISTSVFASMPFSLSSLMNSEVLVVGIRPVTTFCPLTSLMLSNLKSGAVAIHTAAPFTTLAMMSTSAPLEAAIAVPSRPWIENCALPEITAESAMVGAPAVSLVRGVRLLPRQTFPLDRVDHVIENESHDHESEQPDPDRVEVVEARR